MKKLLQTTLGALMILLLVTSCDKKKEDLFIGVEKEITTADMKNPRNPNDKQGEIHNEFLSFFAKKMDKNKKEVTREDYSKIVEDFHGLKKLEFGEVQRRNYESIYGSLSELKIGGPAIDLDICKRFPALCNLTGTGPYNPAAMLNPSNGGTSYERTLKFIVSIRESEEKVIGNKELNDKDREDILNFYAVARHSAGYWHNEMSIKKDKSDWYGNFATANAAKPCHVCDVVGADAAGATVGGIFGPIGAGIGAGVASAAAVIEKWFW